MNTMVEPTMQRELGAVVAELREWHKAREWCEKRRQSRGGKPLEMSTLPRTIRLLEAAHLAWHAGFGEGRTSGLKQGLREGRHNGWGSGFRWGVALACVGVLIGALL